MGVTVPRNASGGLGGANPSSFATAAQGALADTALQSADLIAIIDRIEALEANAGSLRPLTLNRADIRLNNDAITLNMLEAA